MWLWVVQTQRCICTFLLEKKQTNKVHGTVRTPEKLSREWSGRTGKTVDRGEDISLADAFNPKRLAFDWAKERTVPPGAMRG